LNLNVNATVDVDADVQIYERASHVRRADPLDRLFLVARLTVSSQLCCEPITEIVKVHGWG